MCVSCVTGSSTYPCTPSLPAPCYRTHRRISLVDSRKTLPAASRLGGGGPRKEPGIICRYSAPFGRDSHCTCDRDSTTRNISSCRPPTFESASRSSAASSIWSSAASCSMTITRHACCPASSRIPNSACSKSLADDV